MAGDGDFGAEVVGESHYQESLELAAGGRGENSAEVVVWAVLVPETDNPYDTQAVRVDVNGRTVGHLPRDSARVYRRALARIGCDGFSLPCEAVIVGGWQRGGDRGMFGIRLDLVPPRGRREPRIGLHEGAAPGPFAFELPPRRRRGGPVLPVLGCLSAAFAVLFLMCLGVATLGR